MATGKGKVTWAEGDVYEGDYIDGERTGKGKMTRPDGSFQEGYWLDGEFVESLADRERSEKKRIAKEERERIARQVKKEKYDRIYNACLLDKGSDVDMQVSSLENAVKKTCESIAKDPS